MTLNDRSTPLALLATRRSAKARDLVAPGPDAAQLATILAVAARTPDHGKLAPWRFVEITDRAARHQFAQQAPCLVAVLSTPQGDRIPRWEQELSAGAACMNLLHAAHALGFAGSWLTTWAAFAKPVRKALGAAKGDRIAGFLFLGTAPRDPGERPRPDPAQVVRRWP